METGTGHTGQESGRNLLTCYPYKLIGHLEPIYNLETNQWTDVNPTRTEIIDRTNEYLRQTECIGLGKLSTFILIPKQVDAQTGDICIEAFNMLNGKGFLVFYTMIAGAGKLVCIPSPAMDSSDAGVDAHMGNNNLLMIQLSHFFVIGAGAVVYGSDHDSGIIICNDLMDVFPDGRRGERYFDAGMPPTIAASRDASRQMVAYRDGRRVDFGQN